MSIINKIRIAWHSWWYGYHLALINSCDDQKIVEKLAKTAEYHGKILGRLAL